MEKDVNSENPIYKIAAEISDQDGAVLKEMSECLSDTKKYFMENEEDYEERSVTFDEGEEVIQWLISLARIIMSVSVTTRMNWEISCILSRS